MTTDPRDDLPVATFVDEETRQLWVRVRATDEVVYIEDNTAPDLRREAEAFRRSTGEEKWGCIIPTCNARITFAGNTKRDFYRHIGAYDHGGESADHLASKEMLDQWAKHRLQGIGSSRQEARIDQQPGMSTYRVVDVMTTWNNTGEHIALEVEYKNYNPADWAIKQNDFNHAGVTCTWLIGHSRLIVKDSLNPTGDGPWEVRLTPLSLALAKAGLPVLAVNPSTGQVGTIAATPQFDHVHDGQNPWGYLTLDPLEECDLHPRRGLITPAMRTLAANIAARRQREAEQAALDAARRAELEARQKAKQAAQAEADKRRADAAAQRKHAWETSPDHAHMHTTHGGIPLVILRFGNEAKAIRGQAAYWHTAIYRDLVENKPTGTKFHTTDCWQPILKRGMTRHPDYEVKGLWPLRTFLEALEREGLLQRQGKDTWVVLADLTTITPLKAQQATTQRQQQAATHRDRMQRQQANADTKRAEQVTRQHAQGEHLQRQADQDEQRLELGVEFAIRWNASPLKTEVQTTFGRIPDCILWPGDIEHRLAFNADYLEIRAHIVMRHIHPAAPGAQISPRQILDTLTAAGYTATYQPEATINNYLVNLSQRGIVAVPNNQLGTYTRTNAPVV